MIQPVLTTERLTLRPFRLSDANEVQRLAGNRAIADTTLHVPHPYGDGVAENWIQSHAPKYDSGELASFAIVRRSDESLLGAIGVTIAKPFFRGDLGYWMGEQYWNQGYCTEAARCIVNFSFSSLNLHKIVAYHLTRNAAPGRVMQKLGMRQEGLLREHTYRWGKFEDLVAYGLLSAEYSAP